MLSVGSLVQEWLYEPNAIPHNDLRSRDTVCLANNIAIRAITVQVEHSIVVSTMPVITYLPHQDKPQIFKTRKILVEVFLSYIYRKQANITKIEV